MKVVINTRYGGFRVSKEVYDYLGIEWDGYGDSFDENRTDKKLIEAIESIGLKKSSGKYSTLKIVEVPDDAEWQLEEYDGLEWIEEKHRIWY